MPLLDFSPQTLRTIARTFAECKTLTDAEKYLQDAFPKISRPQAFGMWDGFSGRPEPDSLYADWDNEARRAYRSGLSLGRGMR